MLPMLLFAPPDMYGIVGDMDCCACGRCDMLCCSGLGMPLVLPTLDSTDVGMADGDTDVVCAYAVCW